VDDEIAIILEDPLGVVVPLNADRHLAPVLQLEVNFVTDRLVLPGVVSRADEEVIGEAGDLAKIEDYDIVGLLGLCGPDCTYPILFNGLD
jgi:hypothetical protein